MSKRKFFKEWQADPAVEALLKNVIRSSKKSYYRIGPDGRHCVAPVKIELVRLGISGTLASRLLQEYQFPVAEFIYNRKPAPPLPEAVLAARREKKVLKEQTKAAAKAKTESDTIKAIPAVEEV